MAKVGRKKANEAATTAVAADASAATATAILAPKLKEEEPAVSKAKKEPIAGIEWMTVPQIRQLLNEIRQLSQDNHIQLHTVLSNGMTVEQFCTIFALGQHKKRFQKK